jgi:uncharacterized protein (TIGR04255 family)
MQVRATRVVGYMPQTTPLPERISPDAIIEALVEFRFERGDELPEAIVGRLLDAPLWTDYAQVRLATADIPQTLRENDPNLRYLPIIELRKKDASRIAKVGGRVFSYHVLEPYPGWTVFHDEIETVVRSIVESLKFIPFSRLGLRYINVFRPEEHHVLGLTDTNISLSVRSELLAGAVNINYMKVVEPTHIITVKIATPEFVIGNLRPGFSLLCDIDVATKGEVSVTGAESTMSWITTAHDLEKQEFFKILRDEITKTLSATGEG